MKRVGYIWNNRDIEIVEINGEMYTLHGWNGEAYYHCWKVADEKGFDRVDEDEYILTPISQGVGDVDEDGNYDSYETINYEITVT